MNRYVAVQYQRKDDPSDFGSMEYTYVDGLGLMKGDLVVAPTSKGNRLAKVIRVGIPESEIDNKILKVLKTIDTLHTEGAIDNG